MNLVTEHLLNATFHKANFCCGNATLDNYLHTKAKQDIKNNLAHTFVVPDGKDIIGYYSLSSASISRDIVPPEVLKKLGKYSNLPVTLLGRLTVDKKYQGQSFGKILLIDALARSYLAASGSIASFAVVVDPIDEQATAFYKKYDFIELDNGRMFLSMKSIKPVVQHLLSH